MKVSDCCGVTAYSNGDSDTEDIGICPECKEHCEYIDAEEDDIEPCSVCGAIDGMVNPCCVNYDPLHYKNSGYG